MQTYLRETKMPNGRVVKNLVKLPDKKKFWEKEKKSEISDGNYFSYQNHDGKVIKATNKTRDGCEITHTLMSKPEKVKRR